MGSGMVGGWCGDPERRSPHHLTSCTRPRWVLCEEPNYRGRMSLVEERGPFRSFSSWVAHSTHPASSLSAGCQLARPEPGEARERAKPFLPVGLGTMGNKRHQSGE